MIREYRARLNEATLGIALAAACSFVAATPAAAQPARASCLARHYATYADAQRDYQRTVERLLVQGDSGVRELATLARAEQLARIAARERAVAMLLSTSPAAVHVDRPLNEWLDWGRAESERLSRADGGYARLAATADSAAARVRGHPSWPRVQQAMRERVQSSPEHRAALDRLTSAMTVRPRCGS